MNKKDKIIEYIRVWDPFGFINDGFPEDEYDLEASIVYWEYEKRKNMSTHNLSELLYTTLTERFELDPDDFRKQCKKAAMGIMTILKKNQ